MSVQPCCALLAALIIFISCSKSAGSSNSASIDVTKQWFIDDAGLLIQGLSDGQWSNRAFTSQEQNLFSSLDTANLAGTSQPDSVFEESPVSHNYIIPNPYSAYSQLHFQFTNGFSGTIMFKMVVVDNHLKPVDKEAFRIQASVCSGCAMPFSNSSLIRIMPNIPAGQYRLYYTLGSVSNPQFYTSWGNIQRNP